MSAELKPSSNDRRSVAVIGDGAKARQCAQALIKHGRGRFRLAAVVGPADAERFFGFRAAHPSDAGRDLHDARDVALTRLPARVVVALDDRRGSMPVDKLVDLRFRGVEIQDAATFLEELTGKIPVLSIHPADLAYGPGFRLSRVKTVLKVGGEYLLAIAMCTFALPIIALAALGVLIETGRPIFYTQERVGLRGRIFRVIKLRTMVKNAETNGPQFSSANDARITRWGRFLRGSRIDELPQLINVMKGEMALVGPRPERPMFVEQYRELTPYFAFRHSVRPGVTGWAQVRYGYTAGADGALEKLSYDLYYIKNFSPWLDFRILLKTIRTILGMEGR